MSFPRIGEMPIKNFYTAVPVDRTVSQIMAILARHGASEIMTAYGDDHQPIGLQWRTSTESGPLAFRLPVNVEAVFQLLTRSGLLKTDAAKREAQARRVAWRNVKDWIDAQMALLEAEQVRVEEIFLPYMLSGGQTLYEAMLDRGFRALPAAGSDRV